ncbi:MAG: RusA family crossover junction endodeoxyribonuclease, partial [Gloeomargarita sp. SKYG116]|nr:RusA family crossover junction endodeoxyribonuclease [Gloeomargarita sp. SKYG116]MDW8402492.1 RusA family crossover junction endodeoxyribonuclease [Gloeomargarita sp. SKYGB_i_bin116]
MNRPALKFCVSDYQPKPRPRAGRWGVYLPPKYKNWKLATVSELEEQMFRLGRHRFPIEQATIRIELHGQCRGDPDNLAGAILDALVAAGVLADDRLR